MQQGEANCKIAPLSLSVTLFPLHLLPTQTARRASGNNCQIPRRTFAPFLACISFRHMSVCMCVCVPTCLDCWMQTGAKATASHCSSYPLPISLAPPSPSLHLSHMYTIIPSWSHCPRWLPLHCMAFTSFRDTWGALGLNEVHTPSCTSKRAADRDAAATTDAVEAAN